MIDQALLGSADARKLDELRGDAAGELYAQRRHAAAARTTRRRSTARSACSRP